MMVKHRRGTSEGRANLFRIEEEKRKAKEAEFRKAAQDSGLTPPEIWEIFWEINRKNISLVYNYESALLKLERRSLILERRPLILAAPESNSKTKPGGNSCVSHSLGKT